MKIQIVDASVAIKWFVNEEKGKAEALNVLERIKKSPRYFVVPELFFNEMLAVLVKLVKDPVLLKEYINALQDLGFERIGNGRALLDTAVNLSTHYKLSGYDAIYAACAKLTDGIWITFDREATKQIKTLGITELL